MANLLLRGSAALAVLIAVNVYRRASGALMITGAGQSLILAHIGFNLAVFAAGHGFCQPVGAADGPVAA